MQTNTTPKPSGLIPRDRREAIERLKGIQCPLNSLRLRHRGDFLHGWNALFYLNPGLHPDESENPEGGWPSDLQLLAKEAWRRFDAGQLSEDELYCSDATWAGLCDEIATPTAEELAYRQHLAAA